MSVNTYRYPKKHIKGNVPHVSTAILARREVISLSLTLQSYRDFIDDVLRIAKLRTPAYACFANVHMLVEAAHDRSFAQVVNKSTWVTADGVPLLWALKAFYNTRQERITGLDVLPTLLEAAALSRLPVYVYGSTPSVLSQYKAFCAEQYPGLNLVGMYSPPFRPLSLKEEQKVVNTIINSGAALVFVALGCPKQEKWMAAVSDRIPAVLLGIGGALPVLVGEQKRAPQWMQKRGLEWLYRFIQEPRRLLGRYVTTNLWFVYYFFRQLIWQRSHAQS